MAKIRNRFVMNIKDQKIIYKYDLIWDSWGICYIMDSDLLEHLHWARKCLVREGPNEMPGVYFIKESVTHEDELPRLIKGQELIVRTKEHYRRLFEEAGFQIMDELKEYTLRKGLDKIMMWVIKS